MIILLTPDASPYTPHLTSPHLTSPHLTSPRVTSPRLASPRLASPRFISPNIISPRLTSLHPCLHLRPHLHHLNHHNSTPTSTITSPRQPTSTLPHVHCHAHACVLKPHIRTRTVTHTHTRSFALQLLVFASCMGSFGVQPMLRAPIDLGCQGKVTGVIVSFCIREGGHSYYKFYSNNYQL